MEKKYTVLRVIATLYKILAVLIALGTILFAIFAIIGATAGSTMLRQFGVYNSSSAAAAIITAIMFLIGGGISALGVFAVGEGIYLLIGLEENTRFTAVLLRDRFYTQPQAQPMMPPANPNYPPAP